MALVSEPNAQLINMTYVCPFSSQSSDQVLSKGSFISKDIASVALGSVQIFINPAKCSSQNPETVFTGSFGVLMAQ